MSSRPVSAVPHAAFVSGLRKRERPVAPVTVIFGDEPLFREEALAALSARFFEDSPPGSAPVVLHGPEGPRDPAALSLASFLDEARTEPLFGGKKLVVLRRADTFMKQHADALIEELARSQSAGSIAVVLLAEGGGKPDDAILAAFESCEGRRPASAPPPWQRVADGGATPAAAFAIGRAREMGKPLSAEAASRLVALVGSDCVRLAHEIEKLACYAADRSAIGKEDVEALAGGGSRPESSFAVVDAIFERDGRRALTLLSATLRNGLAVGGWGQSPASVVVDPAGIGALLVASIQSRLRDVALAATRIRAGSTPEAAAAAVAPKSKPFAQRRLAADAKRFEREEPSVLYRWLLDADAGLKGGEDHAEPVLERLILRLTGAAQARPGRAQGG